MTGLVAGQRVAILATGYPAGTVLDPCNDLTYLTVTVQVDATPHTPTHWTYFAPDELELINDDANTVRPEPLPDTGERERIFGG